MVNLWPFHVFLILTVVNLWPIHLLLVLTFLVNLWPIYVLLFHLLLHFFLVLTFQPKLLLVFVVSVTSIACRRSCLIGGATTVAGACGGAVAIITAVARARGGVRRERGVCNQANS